MDNVSIIGIDISKSSFQVRGATSSGEPVLRKKLSRGKVLEFLASQPPCLVVMETLSIPSYFHKMANILLYSLCSASTAANSSSNGRNRSGGQLGICS